jgi:hypothetical protein
VRRLVVTPIGHKPLKGVPEISESNHFLRSDGFQIWLKDEKQRVGSSRSVSFMSRNKVI